MNLTEEQLFVVDEVCSRKYCDKVIAVNSIAGSGKTSTGKAVIEAFKPKKGFYTAFNKAIVQESSKRFGNIIEAKTIHALAYKYIRPSQPIEELNYLTIKETISYEDKAVVINAIDDFYRSSSTNIDEYAETVTEDENLRYLISKYANMMLEGKIPPTFNFLLKCLHLMLLDKEIEIDFDLFVLDECQDTTAVALEIFKLVNAEQKLMFGDKFQNIYSFMNTVNAFEELDSIYRLNLTKSFRCNPSIAYIIEKYGNEYLENNFKYSGNEDEIIKDGSIAYITRTNACLIERMINLLHNKKSFSLTRNINDIFALPLAMLNASEGKPVFDRRYKYLQKEYVKYIKSKTSASFFDYISNTVNNSVLDHTSRLLQKLQKQRINLFKLKDVIQNLKYDPKIIVTTAHAFKGLEADSVIIEEDLNKFFSKTESNIETIRSVLPTLDINQIRAVLNKSDKEELNTYYVALSRARHTLINAII
jgi:superfamily I DNA/RNA helicase